MDVAPDGSPVTVYLALPADEAAAAGLAFSGWLDEGRTWARLTRGTVPGTPPLSP